MPETLLSSPYVTELILPFLLVFTLIFAILDKTKILGEGKRQINAIISLVVGLIFVSYTYAVGISIKLIGVMAVIAVIILVFMLLFAFVYHEKEFKMPRGLTITFGVLIAIVLVVSLLVFTGYWGMITSAFYEGSGSAFSRNIIFLVIIIGAIWLVLATGKDK